MKQSKRIIITGAESTGKSVLTKELANYYNTNFVEEYAREYIENIKRDYNYNDLVIIAKKQIEIEINALKRTNKILFIDTGLIITKIWFLEVFKKYPDWLNDLIAEHLPDLYLICDIDLDWKKDPVRENGSYERRKYLMNKYIKEIKNYDIKYYIVSGQGDNRLENAISFINNLSLI